MCTVSCVSSSIINNNNIGIYIALLQGKPSIRALHFRNLATFPSMIPRSWSQLALLPTTHPAYRYLPGLPELSLHFAVAVVSAAVAAVSVGYWEPVGGVDVADIVGQVPHLGENPPAHPLPQPPLVPGKYKGKIIEGVWTSFIYMIWTNNLWVSKYSFKILYFFVYKGEK